MKKILPGENIINVIKCPICASKVNVDEKSLFCLGARRHCYDFASSGYLNLMSSGHTDSGDSKAAVNARRAFLNLDHYKTAATALADVVEKYIPKQNSIVADAGCGEGYYTVEIAKRGYSVVGIDISKFAAEASAKRAAASDIKDGLFCVGSVFSLPFLDNSVDCVINVFAPCAEKEFERVLKKGGYLIVMYAGREHLMGLKAAIYDNVRENDERKDLPMEICLVESQNIRFDITVEGSDALQNLFAMTPYYWKTSQSDGERLKNIDKLTTAVDMVIAVYQKI